MNKNIYIKIMLTAFLILSTSIKPVDTQDVVVCGSAIGAMAGIATVVAVESESPLQLLGGMIGGGLVGGLLSYWIAYSFTHSQSYLFKQAKEKAQGKLSRAKNEMYLNAWRQELFDIALVFKHNQRYNDFYHAIYMLKPENPYALVTFYCEYKKIKRWFNNSIQLLEAAIASSEKAKSLRPNILEYSNIEFKSECTKHIASLRFKITVLKEAMEALAKHPDFKEQSCWHNLREQLDSAKNSITNRLDILEDRLNELKLSISLKRLSGTLRGS